MVEWNNGMVECSDHAAFTSHVITSCVPWAMALHVQACDKMKLDAGTCVDNMQAHYMPRSCS